MTDHTREIQCNKGCGMLVHFDDAHISKSGKKIPLEHDGEPHQCPNSDYNKTREARTAGAAGIEQWAAMGTMLETLNDKLDKILVILTGQQQLDKEGSD